MQASARLQAGSLRLLRGEQLIGGWYAGDGLEKAFCRECGCALFARDHDTGEIKIVRLGAIDGDPGVRPSAHQFVAYAAAWAPIPDDGLPRFAERIAR